MGARLYNPETGRFLSIDPVPGGNDNRYIYPADPQNLSDTSGRSIWGDLWNASEKVAKWLTNSNAGRAIETACGFAWGLAGAICGGVYTLAYARQGRWVEAGASAAGMVVGGAVTKAVFKGMRRAYISARTVSKGRYAMASWRAARGNRFAARVLGESTSIAIGAAFGYFGKKYSGQGRMRAR